MSLEENKTLARRLCAAWNACLDGRNPSTLTERDLAIFDEIIGHDLAQAHRHGFLSGVYDLWGDHHIEITDLIAEGDNVWLRVATSGGHTGEWLGIAPTGKRWTNTGVLFMRIEGGRIAEWTGQFDTLNHASQLGATLVPPKG
jgi:predicted ester cyclase